MTERTLSYRPGSWLGIVGENATVLLPASEKARVGSLWALIDDGLGFDAVLDALVSGGLTTLPGFVLATHTDEGVRVLVRGEARVTFDTDQGTVTVASVAGEMWRERTVAADDFSVELPGEDASGPLLTVATGLVRLGAVEAPELDDADSDGPWASVVSLAPAAAAADDVEGDDAADNDLADNDPADNDPVEPVSQLHSPVVPAGLAVPIPISIPSEVTTVAESSRPELGGFDLDDASSDEFGEDDLPTDVFPAYAEPVELDDEAEVNEAAETDEADAAEADDDAPTDDIEPITEALLGDPPAWNPGTPVPAAPVVPAPPLVPVPPAPPALPEHPTDDEHPEPLTEALLAPPKPAVPTPPHLSFAHGAEVDVLGLVVIGRNPDPRRFADDAQPHLVTVPSPHSEISSTHVEVRPGTGSEAGLAVVTDLGSTNGTVVVAVGGRPEELRAGVPMALASGSLIDLGDGMTIRVR